MAKFGYLCALLGAVWIVATAPAAGQSFGNVIRFKEDSLTIESGARTHRFRVEVARTPRQQSRGLMFRRRLAADRGMLFVYRRPARVSMWMKNTLIPLDMLFIGDNGIISRIVERTRPYSERTIASNGPVSAVLELNAGTVARLGIRTGDRVVSRALER